MYFNLLPFTSGIRLSALCGFFLIITRLSANAQNLPRYLVLFTDKTGTPYTLNQPEEYLSERAIARRSRQNIPVSTSDLPVNPAYVNAVRNTGAYVLHSSRWFNGVVVSASETQLEAISLLPFFKGLERETPLTNTNYSGRVAQNERKFGEETNIDYGSSQLALEMLGVPRLHQLGHTGSGLLIGVLDSGFNRADQQGYLSHLFTNNQIIETYDFISRHPNVYDDHHHGLQVLSVMASKWDGYLVGPAFDAQYVLYRTENVFSETPYEEVAWLIAAERSDSIGVDIINTSLGYYDFDNAAHNYTYQQMDGKTTIISRAARYASRTGMLLVNSAGNEGGNAWRYLTAPADVDSVLTVGAVTSTGTRANFSSFGPNAEGIVKPDVAALGSSVRVGNTSQGLNFANGTSFSSPLIASFAALLWQAHPDKTAQELASLIRSLGNQAASPDDELGYGIPYYDEVLSINQPTNLTTSLAINVVNLAWDEVNNAQLLGYEIERSINNGPFELIARVNDNQFQGDTLTTTGSYQYRVRALFEYRQSAYSSAATVQFTITGLEEASNIEVTLSPNPADLKLNLHFGPSNEAVNATIFTPSGISFFTARLVPVNGRSELAIDGLSPGLYLLKLSSDEGKVVVKKFVKR